MEITQPEDEVKAQIEAVLAGMSLEELRDLQRQAEASDPNYGYMHDAEQAAAPMKPVTVSVVGKKADRKKAAEQQGKEASEAETRRRRQQNAENIDKEWKAQHKQVVKSAEKILVFLQGIPQDRSAMVKEALAKLESALLDSKAIYVSMLDAGLTDKESLKSVDQSLKAVIAMYKPGGKYESIRNQIINIDKLVADRSAIEKENDKEKASEIAKRYWEDRRKADIEAAAKAKSQMARDNGREIIAEYLKQGLLPQKGDDYEAQEVVAILTVDGNTYTARSRAGTDLKWLSDAIFRHPDVQAVGGSGVRVSCAEPKAVAKYIYEHNADDWDVNGDLERLKGGTMHSFVMNGRDRRTGFIQWQYMEPCSVGTDACSVWMGALKIKTLRLT